MELVYVVGILSTGFAAVVLTALMGELMCARCLREALAKLPQHHFAATCFGGGTGLALDSGSGTVCLLSRRGGETSTRLISINDVVRIDAVKGGQILLRSHERGPESDALPPIPETPAGLRVLARMDGKLKQHYVPLTETNTALQWFSAYRQSLGTQQAPAVAPQRPKPESTASRPSKSAAVPTPVAAEKPASSADSTRRVRDAMAGYVDRKQRCLPIRVSEKELRRMCGLDVMPLSAFHRALNITKRRRMLPAVRMSYRRKDDTWRLSKRLH